MKHPAPSHRHDHDHSAHTVAQPDTASVPRLSVLGWPAWQRILAILPVVAGLWLAVWWASAPVQAW